MEPMEPKPGMPNAPLAGFVVILFSAIFVGGWLYVDAVRNELEMKIEAVQAQVDAARMGAERKEGETKSATMSLRTFDDGGFTFSYPERLGALGCVETGTAYFGYDIEKMTRTWATDGPSFRYEFWDARPLPDNEGAEAFQAILLGMNPEQADGPSCFVRLAPNELTLEEKAALLASVQVK